MEYIELDQVNADEAVALYESVGWSSYTSDPHLLVEGIKRSTFWVTRAAPSTITPNTWHYGDAPNTVEAFRASAPRAYDQLRAHFGEPPWTPVNVHGGASGTGGIAHASR